MGTRTRTVAALLAAGIVVLAGCGDDSEDAGGAGGGGGGAYGGGGAGGDESGGGSATELRLAADPDGALRFDKSELSAKPGAVTITMDNPSDVPHAVELEGQGVAEVGETVGRGGVSRVSAKLEAGTYEFVCPVGNHADAGMTGTLTVG